MRRVSIGMIEAVLFIKYRNTQPDSTAVLLKEFTAVLCAQYYSTSITEYWQMPQPSIQVATTEAGTSAMAPPLHPSWGSA